MGFGVDERAQKMRTVVGDIFLRQSFPLTVGIASRQSVSEGMNGLIGSSEFILEYWRRTMSSKC